MQKKKEKKTSPTTTSSWSPFLNFALRSNLLDIIYRTRVSSTPSYPMQVQHNLISALPTTNTRRPECNMDLAGKWPLALKLATLGLHKSIFLDFSSTGGVLTRNGRSPDGLFLRTPGTLKRWLASGDVGDALIEIKGSISPPAIDDFNYSFTFYPHTFREDQLATTHFFFVLRVGNPDDWGDLDELESQVDIAYARMSSFMEVLRTWKDVDPGLASDERNAATTWTFTLNPKYSDPEYVGQTGTMCFDLSRSVEWVRLRDLNTQWFFDRGLLPRSSLRNPGSHVPGRSPGRPTQHSQPGLGVCDSAYSDMLSSPDADSVAGPSSQESVAIRSSQESIDSVVTTTSPKKTGSRKRGSAFLLK